MLEKSLLGIFLFSLCFLIACDSNKVEVESSFKADTSLCDFYTGSCNQKVDNVEVQLTFKQPNAPSESPIDLSIQFSTPVTDVKMTVEGRDMFMGIIPVFLQKTNSQSFDAQLIYGSCSSNYMVWRANVSFEHEGISRSVWFDFLADAQHKSAN
ncbi:hypothetical protein ACRWQM_08620 [Shewanella sp. HL-SH5]|uniref:hypothetical protein n=1 Tax=Shewanella sp. HL-SH5 TaxID=3436241 RepID=UPI003EB6E618